MAKHSQFLILNLINVGHFNKAVGSGKYPQLINVGPTFIPEFRVEVHGVN